MKKIILSLLLAVLTTGAFAANLEAKVISTKGKTEVQRNGAWIPLTLGSTLNKGDVIQTGFKSSLVIKIRETTVSVDSLTRITIEQLAAKKDKDDTRLFIDTGSLKSNVKKTEDRRVGFTVRSPVVTASVRGTVLGVSNRFGSTDVIGYSGSIATWKNPKPASAEIAAEEPETAAPVMTGNTPEAVSDGAAPKGAILVKPGMVASYTENTTTTPMTNASKSSADLGAAKTPATETAPAIVPEPPASTPAKTSTKASVIVTVSLPQD